MSTIIDDTALTEVERIKAESAGLRGSLPGELENESTHLTDESKVVLKFHGSYQQEDRDQRRERKRAGLEPAYQFMIRSKLPGGVLTPEQYLVHDDLAERYGDGTLRVTTRQGFQLFGVLKGDLRETIRGLNEAMVTTFGACGDVVRAVVACPAPIAGGLRREVIAIAQRLSDETLPRSRSYHQIWVEGVSVTREEETEPDPLYGDRYMPRKFKITFAFPEDNCTDVYANDLGFLAVVDDGRLAGFNVLVGGGFGRTHAKAETFARLADPLGFVPPADVIEVSKAVIAVQREHGNREDRKRARMKYLVDERGVDWFREQVEAHLGRPLDPPAPVEVTGIHDHLGWHEQGDGRWFRGIWVENGRIRDHGTLRLRAGLRHIVETYRFDVHLSAQHNVLLTNIPAELREVVDATLLEYGIIPPEEVSLARRWSMACPALPTCPLSLAESERVLPAVIDEMEVALARLGLSGEELTIRMTGCPNGCARPYSADLAFVGRSLGKYLVYVGGNMEGTRLATPYADLVKLEELVSTVRPLFERYAEDRLPGERFGDFWNRVGLEPLPSAAKVAG